jgi:hypothetical protein
MNPVVRLAVAATVHAICWASTPAQAQTPDATLPAHSIR